MSEFKKIILEMAITMLSEEQDAYKKAWEKHRGEMNHLKDHKFESHWSGGNDSSTGDARKGVQRIYIGPTRSSSGLRDEHAQSIFWHHNNYTRKNHKVITHEQVLKDSGTPYSRESEPVKVEHKNLKAAVTYLNKKKKEIFNTK